MADNCLYCGQVMTATLYYVKGKYYARARTKQEWSKKQYCGAACGANAKARREQTIKTASNSFLYGGRS